MMLMMIRGKKSKAKYKGKVTETDHETGLKFERELKGQPIKPFSEGLLLYKVIKGCRSKNNQLLCS